MMENKSNKERVLRDRRSIKAPKYFDGGYRQRISVFGEPEKEEKPEEKEVSPVKISGKRLSFLSPTKYNKKNRKMKTFVRDEQRDRVKKLARNPLKNVKFRKSSGNAKHSFKVPNAAVLDAVHDYIDLAENNEDVFDSSENSTEIVYDKNNNLRSSGQIKKSANFPSSSVTKNAKFSGCSLSLRSVSSNNMPTGANFAETDQNKRFSGVSRNEPTDDDALNEILNSVSSCSSSDSSTLPKDYGVKIDQILAYLESDDNESEFEKVLNNKLSPRTIAEIEENCKSSIDCSTTTPSPSGSCLSANLNINSSGESGYRSDSDLSPLDPLLRIGGAMLFNFNENSTESSGNVKNDAAKMTRCAFCNKNVIASDISNHESSEHMKNFMVSAPNQLPILSIDEGELDEGNQPCKNVEFKSPVEKYVDNVTPCSTYAELKSPPGKFSDNATGTGSAARYFLHHDYANRGQQIPPAENRAACFSPMDFAPVRFSTPTSFNVGYPMYMNGAYYPRFVQHPVEVPPITSPSIDLYRRFRQPHYRMFQGNL